MKSIKYIALLLGATTMCLSKVSSQSGWIQQTSGTTKKLWGVWFTNDSTGIVVGKETILRTTDMGNTWNPPTYPEITDHLLDVIFADEMNGWIAGYNGIILNTTDGGVTWNKQNPGGTYSFESVFCVNKNIVYAPEIIIKYTTDGGITWNIQFTPPNNIFIRDIFFINADEGFAVGGNCRCCGGGGDGAYIFHTTNGGGTWTTQKYDSTVVGYHGVCFINDSTGTVVGYGGTILHTTDGGKTWNSQISGTTEDIWDIFYVNSNLAFAVGGNCSTNVNGIILCTENGGETWTKQNIPTNYYINKVFFINDSTGVAVGHGGTILRTKTGGVSVPTKNQENNIFEQLSLSQNYPNPFSRSTSIRFQIPVSYHVTLKVYDINGQEVAKLVNEQMIPGSHEVTWNAEGIPAGVYFYKLEAGTYIESRKLVLIR